MPLNIFLTVDVECGDHCVSYDGSVFGKIINHPGEQHGLEFILRTLQEFQLKCTFFVETFSSLKFGIEGLKEICQRIEDGNQEVQLHIHEDFLGIKSLSDLEIQSRNYSYLREYAYHEQLKIIKYGKEILNLCGVKEVVGFRAGGFGANNVTLKALKDLQIKVDSSYNLSYLNKSCYIEAGNESLNDASNIDGIIELPITNYRVRYLSWIKPRHLQVGAATFFEMRSVISKAENYGLNNICILLHSNEFINFINKERTCGVPNKINKGRFKQLCDFLSNNRNCFTTRSISYLTNIHIAKSNKIEGNEFNIPSVSVRNWSFRNIQQVWKRLYCLIKGCRPLG